MAKIKASKDLLEFIKNHIKIELEKLMLLCFKRLSQGVAAYYPNTTRIRRELIQ